jgi:acetyl esterase/lipase
MSWRGDLPRRIPIRAFHGDQDRTVPVAYSMMMVQAVNGAGGHAELTLYPGVHHDSWVKAYEQSDLIAWLIAQKKK